MRDKKYDEPFPPSTMECVSSRVGDGSDPCSSVSLKGSKMKEIRELEREAESRRPCLRCGVSEIGPGHICDEIFDEEEKPSENVPIGKCEECGTPIYYRGGFCGICSRPS